MKGEPLSSVLEPAVETPMVGKSVITLDDLSIRQIQEMLHKAQYIDSHRKEVAHTCEGRVLATLFYEPSTRTRLSFETAMLRLGGKVIGFAGAQLASVTKGDNTEVTFSWAAVPNASTYTYRLALTTLNGETEEVVRLSETVSATRMTVPAATVATLKPGTYTISVTAAAVSDYLYKPSPAGTAALTVADTKLAAPAVKFTPAKVTKGDQTEVTASWEAVEGAASYDVSFNGGASENVTGTSYTIAAATVGLDEERFGQVLRANLL